MTDKQTNESNGHKCPKNLGLLVESLQPVVFHSLPIERTSRKNIADELARYSDVTEAELAAFTGEVDAIQNEEVETAKALLEYGSGFEGIKGELGRQIAGCGRCDLAYRHHLKKLVALGEYDNPGEADEARLHLYF